MNPIRSEKVKEIIAEEISLWTERHKAEPDGKEKIKIHGAISLLMVLSGIPNQITREFLLQEYKYYKRRAENAEIKDRELDLIARNRAVKSCEMLVSLGKKIAELEATLDKQK